jgi:uncharacterized protein YbaP (TraB family)
VTFRALLLALAAWTAAGTVRAQPPVWVVRDADSEMVLFGSIHILPPGLDWTPPALTRDLARAEDLWFELPIDPATQAQVGDLALTRGMAPLDQPLSKLLSPEGRARLKRICERYGVAPATLERFQPWYAEVAIAWVMFRQTGADADSGVEKQISARAPATAQRRAFETPGEQIALFADTPLADQVASLEQSLEEAEETPDQLDQLVRHWQAGDLAALDRDALEPLREASPTIFQRLITDRNVRWTETLQQRLVGKGRTVVVVGMGHMIGPGGLPARLRALGYSVEGP